MNKKKRKASPYDARVMPKMVKQMILDGIPSRDFPKRLGIHPATMYRWKKEHEEFKRAFDEGYAEREKLYLDSVPAANSKYKPETTPQMLRTLLAEDLTVPEIAKRFDISIMVFYSWIHKYKAFSHAYEEGAVMEKRNRHSLVVVVPPDLSAHARAVIEDSYHSSILDVEEQIAP